MFINWNEFFKRLDVYSHAEPVIPKNAIKTEETLEQDGYKTTTTTYKAPGFSYVISSTVPIEKEKGVLETLQKSLQEAVDKEDYLKAAELKKEIELCKENG